MFVTAVTGMSAAYRKFSGACSWRAILPVRFLIAVVLALNSHPRRRRLQPELGMASPALAVEVHLDQTFRVGRLGAHPQAMPLQRRIQLPAIELTDAVRCTR